MTEFEAHEQERAEKFNRERALDTVVKEYLETDEEFLSGHDLDDRIGAVYGMLLEQGEDPDVILGDAGVLEKEDDNEV